MNFVDPSFEQTHYPPMKCIKPPSMPRMSNYYTISLGNSCGRRWDHVSLGNRKLTFKDPDLAIRKLAESTLQR